MWGQKSENVIRRHDAIKDAVVVNHNQLMHTMLHKQRDDLWSRAYTNAISAQNNNNALQKTMLRRDCTSTQHHCVL